MDYKFFCFDGEPKFLYVSDSLRHKLIFLNTDWTPCEYTREDYTPLDDIPKKPKYLEELLNIARRLAAGIPHIRVDLYYINGNIYFGELTFFTGSGFIPFTKISFDKQIGTLLHLPSL